jgi:hypothetical protein
MKGTAEGVGRSFFFCCCFFLLEIVVVQGERERERDRQRAHISLPARHSRKARPAEPSLIVVINFFLLLLLLLSFVLGLVTERAQPDSRVRAESGFQPRDGPVELVDALRVDAEGGEAGVPALAASERVAGLDGVPVVEGFEVFSVFFRFRRRRRREKEEEKKSRKRLIFRSTNDGDLPENQETRPL